MLEPTESASAESAENDNTPSDNLPPRRRRAASRPAGPPTGGAAPEATVATTQSSAPTQPTQREQPTAQAAQSAAGEPAEASAKPVRERRRATRKASAPAGPPAAEQASESQSSTKTQAPAATSDAPKTPAPESPAAESSAAEPPTAEEASAKPARTRRRASRKASEPVTSQPQTPAEESATAESATPEAEPPAVEPTAATGRARTRSARKDGPERASQESAEASVEPAKQGRRTKRASATMNLFQAPVFTEPMFQTPQSAAAAQAAEEEEDDEGLDVVGTEESATSADDHDRDDSGENERPSRRRRRGGRRRRRAELAEENGEADSEDQEDQHEESTESGRPERAQKSERRSGRDKGDRNDRNEKSGKAAEVDTADQSDEADGDDHGGDNDDSGASNGPSTSSSRRRRRRRRRSDGGGDSDNGGAPEKETPGDDPERTVVKIREPRKKQEPSDEVQSIKGSTRLEAKKQRRREGREQGRRRVPIITEAEFLARREAVKREMIVRQHGERTQIAVLEDDVLVEHFVNKEQATSYVGNVYLGKVQNVLPSMEAAFVDIGKGRNAVLYAGEVNFEALGMGGGPRRIESALKSGQSVLVQVTKDPIGHKGARLTSQVSLPGRYLVYVPEGSMTGISRKLPDTERARLKQILKKVVPEDAGVIVRTAAEGASEDELARDVQRLQAQWEDIQKKAQKGNAPTLLYGEPDMTVRVVRDIFNEDFSKVVISGDEAWNTVHGYVSHVAPDLVERLNKWTSDVDVFATYRIDEQLMKALDRKVWLPSGGSLVIDRTEAMIVVDVNTGKFTGQGGNLEETVTRNNLEAAEEIVRQLRLRDLGGIIVIDFIDMVLENNRDLVLRRLLECLGRDRTKHQVAEVTSLGLVQMTRKRVGQGLLESFSETCVHCNGRGVIVHMEQPQGTGGGGKRGKKKGKGGQSDAKPVLADEESSGSVQDTQDVSDAVEAPAGRAESAVEQEPRALPEPAFTPDEELYSSAAEAESAAGAGGRRRRRVSRRVETPSGPPKGENGTAPVVSEPVVASASEATVAEPAAAPAESVTAAEPAQAPAPRTRRRATRKVSAPAGPPVNAAPEAVVVVAPERTESTESATQEAADSVATAPVASAPPARPRRRVTRRVSAPAGTPATESAAAIVLPATDASGAEEPAAEAVAAEAEPASGSKKTAEKAPAKKAPAEKAAAKKSAAKKTAAKAAPAEKAAAKKTAAKKTAAKKTAAKAAPAEKATAKKTAAKTAAKKTAKKATTKKSAAKKAVATEEAPASSED